MGLEKLKSVFAEEAGVNKSQISGRYEQIDEVQPMEENFGLRTSVVDFFGGSNSYSPTLDPSVPGFTKNFNIGGYAFGSGQIGNSQYLNTTGDTQSRTINVDLTNLTDNKLGYGSFQTPNFEENDTRFTIGLGWPFANTILQVSKEGNAASLWYTTTNGKLSVGASGAISNFGPISDIAQKIGVSIPPLDFSADILSSKPLRYEDTIWEKNNFTPTDIGSDLPPGYLGNQRGIVFQSITPNVNKSIAIENSAPGLNPISTLNDLYKGIKAGHGAERGATATELINQMNTGLHLYLGNQTSFVKLGPDIYQGSVSDALRAGDIGYIQDKLQDFAISTGEKILDKSGDILATAGKNISDWASGFKVETELPDLTKFVSKFSLKGLKGPSMDFPSFSSMGGFFDGIKLPNLSLPFSIPDINLPDIDLPQLPSISIGGIGIGNFLGGLTKTISGYVSPFSISTPSFPKISIKNNPDLLDLLETIRNDTTTFIKAQSDFKQGLLGDVAGVDGSHTDNINPRSLTPKLDTISNGAPYKLLGKLKYTDYIQTKHPTDDEEWNEDSPTTLGGYYPSTLDKGDLKTLLPAGIGSTLKEAAEDSVANYTDVAEGEKYGLPFYFKDLRDNKYIIFRGYLSGMTQNISPEWTPHSYLGRSEDTYVYSKAKRDINFTFRVYATTKPELQLIYEKLNLLTSLAYPKYKEDTREKNRMMSPLCSLRIGELFGNMNKNLSGFINSLSFNWPDDGVWEIEQGKRVPKQCDVTIGFTVIHRTPPSYNSDYSEFFGFSNSSRAKLTQG